MSAVSGVIADSWLAAALMAVGQLGRSVSLTRSADFQRHTTVNRTRCSESDRLLDADIWCHGLVVMLGIQGRGEWDQDGRDWSVGLPDQFAAEDHHGFDFREDQMTISEDRIPNQSLQTTPRLRLGWHVGRHWRGVSELGRSTTLHAHGAFGAFY